MVACCCSPEFVCPRRHVSEESPLQRRSLVTGSQSDLVPFRLKAVSEGGRGFPQPVSTACLSTEQAEKLSKALWTSALRTGTTNVVQVCRRQHRWRTFFSRWRNCGARSWVCQSNHTVSGCMRWRCSSRLRRQRVEVAQTYRHGQRNPQDIHKLSAVLIRSKSAPELRIT